MREDVKFDILADHLCSCYSLWFRQGKLQTNGRCRRDCCAVEAVLIAFYLELLVGLRCVERRVLLDVEP